MKCWAVGIYHRHLTQNWKLYARVESFCAKVSYLNRILKVFKAQHINFEWSASTLEGANGAADMVGWTVWLCVYGAAAIPKIAQSFSLFASFSKKVNRKGFYENAIQINIEKWAHLNEHVSLESCLALCACICVCVCVRARVCWCVFVCVRELVCMPTVAALIARIDASPLDYSCCMPDRSVWCNKSSKIFQFFYSSDSMTDVAIILFIESHKRTESDDWNEPIGIELGIAIRQSVSDHHHWIVNILFTFFILLFVIVLHCLSTSCFGFATITWRTKDEVVTRMP